MTKLIKIFAIGLMIALGGCSDREAELQNVSSALNEVSVQNEHAIATHDESAAGELASRDESLFPTELPEPPDGFEWVLNPPYSDEFNGEQLDSEKWHDHYPNWIGRVPGKFVPSAISLKDGFLQIKSTVLDPPQGEFTIACGAVQTKAQGALYGYYECRMKASNVSTSSTFWLKNVSGKTKRPFKSTELDIHESIGNAQRWPDFADHMKANTHLGIYSKDKTKDPVIAKLGDKHKIEGRVHEAFHTYGCWWVDANTMKFYLDGKYVFSITPSTELDKTPFDQPMFVNLVCEIYTWEVTPTVEELSDDTRNTTYYDYVRAFKLMPVN